VHYDDGVAPRQRLHAALLARAVPATTAIPDARHFMSETKLADGAVLLTGGYPEDDKSTAAAYLYRQR
jgi:hypothetical protein